MRNDTASVQDTSSVLGRNAVVTPAYAEGSEEEDSDAMPDCSVNDPRYLSWTQRQAGKRASIKREVSTPPKGFWSFQQLASKPHFDVTSAEQASCGPLVLGFDNKGQSVEIPASINRFLRGYQRDGVRFFWSHYRRGEGGLLGDDMGRCVFRAC